MVEKRKFPRFNVSLEVICILSKTSLQVYKSRLLDISKEGLRISDENDFKKGTELGVVIYLPKSNKPAVGKAKVMWSRKISDKCFEKGMRFIRISDRNVERLLNHALAAIRPGNTH
jgi:hypothetical protein